MSKVTYFDHLWLHWKVAGHALFDFCKHFVHGLMPFIKIEHPLPEKPVAEVVQPLVYVSQHTVDTLRYQSRYDHRIIETYGQEALDELVKREIVHGMSEKLYPYVTIMGHDDIREFQYVVDAYLKVVRPEGRHLNE